MNVNNNNINNNPIHQAPGAGQANAPVNAPNIQQVAAHPAPQGMDHAPAANQEDQHMREATQSINTALANGRVYDAVARFTRVNRNHQIQQVQDLARRIAQNWSNEDQDIENATALLVGGQERNAITKYTPLAPDGEMGDPIEVRGQALGYFLVFYKFLPSADLRTEVINTIVMNQNLEMDFKRGVVENFMSDENRDKAELLRMCEPRRYHNTKSARK